MDRKVELESIIIGSLLSDFEEYYKHCRCSITDSMFSDVFLSKVYSSMVKMAQLGKKVDIISLWEFVEYEFDGWQLSRLCMLADMFAFDFKKLMYNRNIYYNDLSARPNYTHISFDEYVNKFVQMYFKKTA